MKRLIIFFIAGILITTFGCEKGNQGSFTGYINGQVVELGTNIPISFGIITTYPLGITTTTNINGDFRFTSLPIGNYKLTIQASGFISQTTDYINVSNSGINSLVLYLSKYPSTSMIIANAGENQYSVGYGTSVTLSAQASSSFNNEPISYQWVQVLGPPVNLISPTTSTPVFTTLPINQLVYIPDNFGLLGITPTETGSYTFRLYAYANGFSDSTEVSIYSSMPKPNITNEIGYLLSNESLLRANVAVGSVVYLNGGYNAPPKSSNPISSYFWSLVSTPPGSKATLSNPLSQTPSFVPDMIGNYVINLTATTGNGLLNESFTVTANSYVGSKDCEFCHNGSVMTDVTIGYQMTGHANAFNALSSSSIVDENCLKCHTTGFDKTPSAGNGGFDDIARSLGWVLSIPVSYQALPITLQTMANVGCESCHGPGSTHTGAFSFNTSVCAQCHDNAPFNPQYTQWLNSPHANSVSPAGINLAGSNFTTCRSCHWSINIVYTNMEQKGFFPIITSDEQPINCVACHNPHSGTNPYSLRVYNNVLVAGGAFTMTDVGEGAICMKCHTDQTSNPDLIAVQGIQVHNTTAEVFAQGQGFTLAGAGAYAESITQSSYHAGLGNISDLCVTCHMAQTPAPGEPGYNTTGEHTFMMSDAQGNDHIAACNVCHGGNIAVSGFDTIDPLYPNANWDGHPSNVTEGVQDQIHGLLSVLACAITTSAGQTCTVNTTDINGNPKSWTITIPGTRHNTTSYVSLTGTTFAVWPTATTQERDAVYNWYIVNNEGSYGIHNTAFDVILLQKAFYDLTGENIPGATLRQ